MGAVLQEIMTLLTGGISSIAQGVGNGLSSLAQAMFLVEGTDGETSLSVFGGLIVIFGGIGLAIGLSTLIFNWLTGLGNR